MKKLLFSIICTASLLPAVNAQVKDRIRISYIGFNCNSETADNALEMDGKGDEIFIQCNWIMADKNNNLEFQGKYRSPIHGDVNGHYGWIKAGSRSDQGGIRSGDQFRGNTAIGEFEISDGELLTVMPTIWEWDGVPTAANNYAAALAAQSAQIRARALQLALSFDPTVSLVSSTQLLLDLSKAGIAALSMAADQLFGQAMDRPIGMTSSGQFSPKSFVLTRSQVRQIAQRNLGYGLGVLQLDYDENQLGNTRCHGAYTILLKIDFLGTTGSPLPTTGSVPPLAPGHAFPMPQPSAGTRNIPPPTSTNIPPPSGTHTIPPPTGTGKKTNADAPASSPANPASPSSSAPANGTKPGGVIKPLSPANPAGQLPGAPRGRLMPDSENIRSKRARS